jgi:beta-hydroxyacyl-ACP dehydratase FabZ
VKQREVEGRLRRPSGLDHAQIRRILPHRYPFLMVDRVVEIDGFRRAVGVKNVTLNEPFFQGHYPDQPIMPGVMIVEALAQLGGLLLLRKLELTGRLPVLMSIDRVKFRRAVVPGDQIRLEAETLRWAAGHGRVQGRATVGGALVAEARLNFAVTASESP